MHSVFIDAVEQPSESYDHDKRAASNPVQAEESDCRKHREQRVLDENGHDPIHGKQRPRAQGGTPTATDDDGWRTAPDWARGSVYTFTRICSMGYIKSVESVFAIIAAPNRRAIFSILVSSKWSEVKIDSQLSVTLT